MSFRNPSFVLTLSCADSPGIVAAIAMRLAGDGCNITDSAQFGDIKSGRFFMRVSFSAPEGFSRDDAWSALVPAIEQYGMTAELYTYSQKARVLILVSKFGHCLNDLLYRHADRRAAHRDPGHRLEPPHLLSTRGEPRHSLPPPAGDARDQGEAGAAAA